MREDGADVDIVPVSATPVRECDCPPNPSGDHTEGCLTTGAMSDPAEVKTPRMTNDAVTAGDWRWIADSLYAALKVAYEEDWAGADDHPLAQEMRTAMARYESAQNDAARSATEGTDDGR